ncbi:glycosyltransferase family 34 protein [Lepidopterella palustris CBS 459.81]|uniref:Glycosyltransferase family 34 protein n=1 Tax=Lepidopterella palustris CBS 459.81 TaxID=1314670 RepID=A0A8E2EDV3_9PEZI|nr:glycosyltransferase family 34 protein [Lepidopterella palustris CBS 459.81]
MQPGPRHILTFLSVLVILILVELYTSLPFRYPYGHSRIFPIEAPSTETVYFKLAKYWQFNVPPTIKSVAKIPKPANIVVLTASDGGGHNSAIPCLLERVIENRQIYCDNHGYQNLWLNTSKYNIGTAHRTWSKIPAVAESFRLYPEAEWVWLIDSDIILMTPPLSLTSHLLSPAALDKGIIKKAILVDGMEDDHPRRTNITMPEEPCIADLDILITQDHQSINTGSVFFKRTAFTKWILEMMTDKMFMDVESEQDALKHLMLEHPLVREHVGIFPQRMFNAYAVGDDNMGFRDGDLLVHFAGCWVGGKCHDWFEEFWERRGVLA